MPTNASYRIIADRQMHQPIARSQKPSPEHPTAMYILALITVSLALGALLALCAAHTLT